MTELNRRNLLTVFVAEDTENKLQAKLLDLVLETGKDLTIISIYPRGSKVIAWLKVDREDVEIGTIKKEEIKKPKKKKKVKK